MNTDNHKKAICIVTFKGNNSESQTWTVKKNGRMKTHNGFMALPLEVQGDGDTEVTMTKTVEAIDIPPSWLASYIRRIFRQHPEYVLVPVFSCREYKGPSSVTPYVYPSGNKTVHLEFLDTEKDIAEAGELLDRLLGR